MVNVLNAASYFQGSGLSSFALSKMQETFLAQIEKETAVDTSKYDAQYDQALADAQTLSKAKGKINAVGRTIRQNLDNIASIKEELFNMKVSIEKAASSGDYEGYSDRFDASLSEVNRQANALPKGLNLTGGSDQTVWSTPEMTYRSDQYGTQGTITGRLLSSDFYIEDGDGKQWVPDWGAKSIQQWESYPNDEDTPEYFSFDGALQLDSLDEDTGAITFTVYPGSDSEATYSGTLYEGGLGVRPTWMYEDLSTEDGRAAAAEAVEAAREAVAAFESNLSAQLSVMESKVDSLQVQIDDLNDEAVAAARKSLEAQAEMQITLQTRYQGMVSTLNAIASTQASTMQLFSNVSVNSKLAGYMIDQTA